MEHQGQTRLKDNEHQHSPPQKPDLRPHLNRPPAAGLPYPGILFFFNFLFFIFVFLICVVLTAATAGTSYFTELVILLYLLFGDFRPFLN